MSRRTAALSALVISAAAGGLVPSLLTGATAAPACPTWTDTKGDAAATLSTQGLGGIFGVDDPRDPSKVTGDPDVDVVAATISSTASVLTAVVKVDKLAAAPPQGVADEHDIYFDLAGKRVNAYTIRDKTPNGDKTVLTDSNGGSTRAEYPFAVKYDVATSSVIMTLKTSDVEKVTGKPVAGLPITNFEADTYNPETFSNYDEAPAAKTLSYVYGADCVSSGGGTPSPTPTPTATPTPTPTPTSGDPMKDVPIAGCSTLTDPKTDGKPAGNGPNDPDLDITALTMRTTATDLLAYVNVDKLTAGTATADGQRYAVDFTFNKHLFTMSASSSAHGSTAVRDAIATSGLVGHVIQLGVDAPSTTAVPPPTDRGLKASGLKASYDLTNSRVVFDLPIADIVKYGGAPLSGPLTLVDAKSQIETNALSSPADTAGGTATWTVGDNKCFTLKTALKLAVVKKGISRTVTAALTAAGKGLAKQVLTVSVNGKKVGTITTDATGKASYTKAKPNQTVKIDFLGSAGFDPSTATTKV